MRAYKTNQVVRSGIYVDVGWPPDVCFVNADDETLAGQPEGSYRRLPTIFTVALGPILGGLFVLLFPALILATLAAAVFQTARTFVAQHVARRAYLITHTWQPSASFLTGSEGEEPAGEERDPLADLSDKVAERRQEDRKTGRQEELTD